jgi:hypothetical protein
MPSLLGEGIVFLYQPLVEKEGHHRMIYMYSLDKNIISRRCYIPL